MTSNDLTNLLQAESRLRDRIAKNLDLVAPGLTLVQKEFKVKSAFGAAGSIDVLAEDEFGHYVVIEIKRCDTVARAAIHELSKYINLLRENEGLGRDEIRCVVVSSKWHELLEPFSYFRFVSDVQVDGLRVEIADDKLVLSNVEPRPVNDLPTFAPEFDLFRYSTADEREQHWESFRERAGKLPFVRAAMCCLDPKEPDSDFRSVLCIWRLEDIHYEKIEEVCGFKIGHLESYAFEGWEPECDVLFWLGSEEKKVWGIGGSAEQFRGTAEKICSILTECEPTEIRHVGRGKHTTTLNDVSRVIRLLSAKHSRSSVDRWNPTYFDDVLTKSNLTTWDSISEGFLKFIGFESVWRQIAENFISSLKEDSSVSRVQVHGFRKRHFFYCLRQAIHHETATLSTFNVVAYDEAQAALAGIVGSWWWDGSCPDNAQDAITEVYGSIGMAKAMLLSAVDETRYDDALGLHGFHPIVIELGRSDVGDLRPAKVLPEYPSDDDVFSFDQLRRFVDANRTYVEAVSEIYSEFPTAPSGSGSFVVEISPEQRS